MLAKSYSRREVLAGIAEFCAGRALLSGIRLWVQEASPGPIASISTTTSPRPPGFGLRITGEESTLRTAERKSQGYQTRQPYTPAKAIEDMDRGGVAVSLLSVTTPRHLVWEQR